MFTLDDKELFGAFDDLIFPTHRLKLILFYEEDDKLFFCCSSAR